jgi:hypothetical protein
MSNILAGKESLEKELYLNSGMNEISDISEYMEPTLLRKTYFYIVLFIYERTS